MTHAKRKSIERLRGVRRRLRDHAAGEVLVATDVLDQKRTMRAEAEDARTLLLSSGIRRFEEAQGAKDLLAYEAERILSAWLCEESKRAEQAAHDVRDEKMAHLRARARELKTMDRALEREIALATEKEKRGEQKVADDLVGSQRIRNA